MIGDSQGPDAIRVWFRLLRLETRIRLAMSDRLRRIGLSVPQCDVLTTLTEAEGLSQQALAARLYVTKGNISGLIDRMVTAGLVERRAIVGDRRSHAVFLTPAGREAAERGLAMQHEFVVGTLGRMPTERLGEFERLLIAARDLVRAGAEVQPTTRKRSTSAGKAAMSSRT